MVLEALQLAHAALKLDFPRVEGGPNNAELTAFQGNQSGF
jgi:hypothetical protein